MSGFDDMIKGVDQKTLEEGMQRANAFAKTEEGKAMIEKFKNSMPNDKDALLKMLTQNPDMMKSIEKFFKG